MSAESSAPQSSPVETERAMLLDAEAKGGGAKLSVWLKLSGPGWLQSAITLGGGSLAGSLFLGMVAGYSMMWLQVVAMLFGVVMLGAIGYVTLSTGERPFGLINRHINPVLGWSWALATLAANIVWCLPQFSLANAAVSQNLMAETRTAEELKEGDVRVSAIKAVAASEDRELTEDETVEIKSLQWRRTRLTMITCGILLAVAIFITMIYDSGGKGLKLYEHSLRVLVGLIVLSFFGVVVKLMTSGELQFGAIFAGLIPDLSLMSKPAPTFNDALAATGEFSSFWSNRIVSTQRDIMITAVATAVGINMTFLFPYSLLKKGWDRSFRGLSLFDLSTGMAIPFLVATGCVVIASANSFHAKPAPGLLGETGPDGKVVVADLGQKGQFEGMLVARVAAEHPTEFAGLEGDAKTKKAKEYFDALPKGDKAMAAMLVKRDAKHLAKALAPLTGPFVANIVFGFGVLAMALSTITILMLISGFTFCEVFGFPQTGMYHRIGCLLPAIGVLGPFVWSGKVAFWLAVPTSVFGMALLPIAYFTFFLLMNNKAVLGDDLPKGSSRVIWNLLMGLACGLATIGAGWSIWAKAGYYGVGAVVALVALALFVHFTRSSTPTAVAATDGDA
ncbi:MAG: divalent metal cation transporter [Planctomycetales bacterium]|jgi:Mn2+/Fe2+ NRAMP family transporter